jgi:hypothetical protein
MKAYRKRRKSAIALFDQDGAAIQKPGKQSNL